MVRFADVCVFNTTHFLWGFLQALSDFTDFQLYRELNDLCSPADELITKLSGSFWMRTDALPSQIHHQSLPTSLKHALCFEPRSLRHIQNTTKTLDTHVRINSCTKTLTTFVSQQGKFFFEAAFISYYVAWIKSLGHSVVFFSGSNPSPDKRISHTMHCWY